MMQDIGGQDLRVVVVDATKGFYIIIIYIIIMILLYSCVDNLTSCIIGGLVV